jgi:DNA/RNA endonuclease YhcR with UshA esterase domain
MKRIGVLVVCALLAMPGVYAGACVAADAPAATQPAEETPKVKPEEAKAHMGKEVIVEGKVSGTRRIDKACFVNFSKDKMAFYVVIFDPALSAATEAPEVKYNGKKIQVKGTVSEHKGKPQIVVKDLAQITIVEEEKK